jgi:hypothetical protein|tara:strand:- start:285 stop:698 length:414 start_codon:yes stop_codon:yes gene_type:complete
MSTGLMHLHHYFPFLFFIVLIISIVRSGLNKIPNAKKDIFLALTLILAHIQLLIGLVLLIPKMATVVDWSGVMGNAASRVLLVEHPLTMLIAVVLITLGKVKAKKIEDNAKANKTVFGYFTVALILIALRTPWDKLF